MVMTAGRFNARRGLGPLRPRRRYAFRRGQAGGRAHHRAERVGGRETAPACDWL